MGTYIYVSNDSSQKRSQTILRTAQQSNHSLNIGKLGSHVITEELRAAIVLFYSQLNEKQRWLYVGLESLKLGYGGDKIIAEFFKIDSHTVSKGRKELITENFETENIRQKGGGRKSAKKTPEIIERIEKIMEYETAGDPMTGLKWIKKTTEKIAHELNSIGIHVSANTAGKLLKDMNYSLRINYKKIGATEKIDSKSRKERDIQFLYIKQRRQEFAARGFPTISVDGKKKELIGNFKNAGRIWRRQAKEVNVYDFKSLAIGRGIPYGIYDLLDNSGLVVIGISYDTPEFAVNSISIWYANEGTACYSDKNEILILADCGGSNSSRSTMWKYLIQQKPNPV